MLKNAALSAFPMASDGHRREVDEAFDRIERTMLPSIAMMLDTLLDAAECGEGAVNPRAYSAELRSLAQQLETLSREIEAAAPAPAEAGPVRSAKTA